jgi:hypothetical protein
MAQTPWVERASSATGLKRLGTRLADARFCRLLRKWGQAGIIGQPQAPVLLDQRGQPLPCSSNNTCSQAGDGNRSGTVRVGAVAELAGAVVSPALYSIATQQRAAVVSA